MRINQHFRCIRDIINSCLLFFSRREIILRPKTPSVVSVMSAESFPGAVEVTCFFLSSLCCFSPPPSTDALHRLQRRGGKKRRVSLVWQRGEVRLARSLCLRGKHDVPVRLVRPAYLRSFGGKATRAGAEMQTPHLDEVSRSHCFDKVQLAPPYCCHSRPAECLRARDWSDARYKTPHALLSVRL